MRAVNSYDGELFQHVYREQLQVGSDCFGAWLLYWADFNKLVCLFDDIMF
jgi:hypothetical protein